MGLVVGDARRSVELVVGQGRQRSMRERSSRARGRVGAGLTHGAGPAALHGAAFADELHAARRSPGAGDVEGRLLDHGLARRRQRGVHRITTDVSVACAPGAPGWTRRRIDETSPAGTAHVSVWKLGP
jgi:hypothetical protein